MRCAEHVTCNREEEKRNMRGNHKGKKNLKI
jgi:hypothetical protein